MVDNNSEHKKEKGVNKNIVATISHDKHKDVLWNNKSVRHLINRIQNKDHRIGTYEIKKYSCLVLITKYISKSRDMSD